MIVILADEVETVLSGIMVEGLYGNDAAAVRKGDGGRFEQALATLLAQFLLIGQREFEDFRPCLPLLERFERLPLAGRGNEPISFLAGAFGQSAIGHAFEAGGKILADLAGHKPELPAGVVISPIPLVGKELIARFEFCIHGGHFVTNRKNRKTYGRFSGSIFFERLRPTLVFETQ